MRHRGRDPEWVGWVARNKSSILVRRVRGLLLPYLRVHRAHQIFVAALPLLRGQTLS